MESRKHDNKSLKLNNRSAVVQMTVGTAQDELTGAVEPNGIAKNYEHE